MLTVFFIMLAGITSGYLLRNVSQLKHTGKLISIFIFLLLFFLGVGVGKNEDIINNFPVIGLQAGIITTGALAGSIFLSWYVYRKFFKK